MYMGFPGSTGGKEAACQWHEIYGFDPWVGKIPWRRACNPFQYSCLKHPMNEGAWWAVIHRVTESDTTEVTEHACNDVYNTRGPTGSKGHGLQSGPFGINIGRPFLPVKFSISEGKEATLKMDSKWRNGRQAHNGTIKSLLIKAKIFIKFLLCARHCLRAYIYVTF